jgi:hypothetical protein
MPPERSRPYAPVLGREDAAARQCLVPRRLSTIDMPKAFEAESIVTSGLTCESHRGHHQVGGSRARA